jgi:hypothetical protein
MARKSRSSGRANEAHVKADTQIAKVGVNI